MYTYIYYHIHAYILSHAISLSLISLSPNILSLYTAARTTCTLQVNEGISPSPRYKLQDAQMLIHLPPCIELCSDLLKLLGFY